MFASIKARVLTDETNVYTEIPALLTASGILEPLIDYFLHRSHDRSLEWMRKRKWLCQTCHARIESREHGLYHARVGADGRGRASEFRQRQGHILGRGQIAGCDVIMKSIFSLMLLLVVSVSSCAMLSRPMLAEIGIRFT
ncbi:MAG: hypothetical protein P4L92_13885 [Rudaea sp.]|nr:hypothetical protein [Rudaea sp.]